MKPATIDSAFRVGKYVFHGVRSYEQARRGLGLSPRELEILCLLARGENSASISKTLGISDATIDTFRRRAYAKLGVHSSGSAIAILMAYLSGSNLAPEPSNDSA
ncbi:MAG: helix-turn-helix transcriptional regulator [Henriciella sp.]|nr:helix-turn-helix transcriptional regulator [Henriciella sp.]